MAAKKKNTALTGLAAYNLVQKQVKQTLEAQEITLKKGKYFKEAEKYTYRDLVKRAFEKTKGKSRQEIETISVEITNKNLVAGGYIKKSPILPEEGTGYDFHNIPYWELADFLISSTAFDDKTINLDNSAFPDLEDISGSKEDIIASTSASNRILNEHRNETGDYGASYSAYINEDGTVNIVLNPDTGFSEDWQDDVDSQLERIEEEGIGKTGGELPKPKKKTETEKKFSTLQVLIEEEEVKKKKAETKEAEEKANEAKINRLAAEKRSLMDDFKFAKEIGDSEGEKEAKDQIKKIQDEIKKLRG